MSLQDDLIRINDALSATLVGCNEHLTTPADTLVALMPAIEETKNAAYVDGELAGREIGVGEGRMQEWEAFWDTYQDGGERTAYSYAFYYLNWNDANFKPKYDMMPTNASDMFGNCRITDLKGILEGQGVTLDLSGCTTALRMFNGATSLTRLGVIDLTNATDIRNLFMRCDNLASIDKVVFSETSGTAFPTGNTYLFQYCAALAEVRFAGTLSFGLDMKWSTKLSKASIESIVAALSDTATGQTLTLSKTAVNAAFETDTDANDGVDSYEWYALKETKPNWTVTTV